MAAEDYFFDSCPWDCDDLDDEYRKGWSGGSDPVEHLTIEVKQIICRTKKAILVETVSTDGKKINQLLTARMILD